MKVRKNEVPENPVQHKCALCPYSTANPWNYKSHLKIHSDEKPFKCPECPFKTTHKNSLNQHFKHVHILKSAAGSSRPFPCPHPGCDYAAKGNSNLVQHSKIHTDEKSFFCSHPNCNFSTKYKQSLVIHTRVHTGEKPFVCQFESCFYAAATQSHLVSHSRTHTKEKPYKCPEPNCEYSATEKSEVRKHGLTHIPKEDQERPSFKCLLCEYSGQSQKRLAAHIKTHTLEKWFKCDEPNCNHEAKTKAHVESHKLTHSNEKPFACLFESCKLYFKTQSNLSQHMKIHDYERQYKCELCPFRAKTRVVVSRHLKTVHSDLRRFKCTEPNCDYAAKIKPNLQRHLLIHKGVRSSTLAPDCY